MFANEIILKYEKILVFRTGFLGDLLVTLPAFWTIRENFPTAEITLLTNSNNKDSHLVTAGQILPAEGIFDKFIDYDAGGSNWLNKLEIFRLALKLRIKRFDCLIYLMNRNRSPAEIKRDEHFFRLCGIRKIIGLEYLKNNLVDYDVPKPLSDIEPEFIFLNNCLVNDTEFEQLHISRKTDLLLSESEIEFGKQWLRKNIGTRDSRRLIALAPGSKWDSKIWGDEKFIRVAEQLISEFDVIPVIFGGKEDFIKGNKIVGQLKNGINTAGTLSVRQSAALLQHCIIYLGNDTGTMHLAASVGVRCVAIFSAVDFPNRWIPVGDRHQILRRSVSCEGCHAALCQNNKLCIELISVQEVYEKCRNFL